MLPPPPREKRLHGYVVDDRGNVFSVHKRKRIRGSKNSKGYLQLSNKMLLHRIVAEAWCAGKSDAKPHVNHIDGNKLNNTPSNLEWCTAAENNAHARQTGLR
jgi:hypothetical protein